MEGRCSLYSVTLSPSHTSTLGIQTHTHRPTFNGPFSGTTQVSQYQKGETNLDFTEARDSEWQWHQLGHMQVCTLLQTDNHTTPHHSVFYRPDALPAAQPTVSKQQQRPFNGLWSGTTRVGRYQKKHSPTHTRPDHRASFITFLHLQRSMASSLFNLRAWQSSQCQSTEGKLPLPFKTVWNV